METQVFNVDVVTRYEAMRQKVKNGEALQWQATEIFKEFMLAEMNEIIRHRKLEKL